MRPPSPPPPRPDPLSFELRRWTALFSLPFAVFMAVAGLYALLWVPALLGGKQGMAVALFFTLTALALAGGVGAPAWRALRQKGPALVVDARGITDNFHLNAHLPWSAIASARVDYGKGNHLSLVLRPGARLPGGEIARARFWRRLFSGGDLRIPLGRLAHHPLRLQEALQGHLAQPRPRPSDEAR